MKKKDEAISKKLFSSSEPVCIICFCHHTLPIDENGILNTERRDQESHAPLNNTKARVGEERNAIESGEEIVNDENEALNGEAAEGERGDTNNR